MLSWINRLEDWLNDHKSNILLLPVTAAGFLFLTLILMVINVLALIRWPFAVLARRIIKSDKGSLSDHVDGTIIEGDPDRLNKILESGELVLVDFWAEWCGPCIMMNDPLKRLAESEKANCTIVKIDTMKHGSLAGQYHVKGLPTLLLFKENHEVKRFAGALTFHQLIEFVNK